MLTGCGWDGKSAAQLRTWWAKITGVAFTGWVACLHRCDTFGSARSVRPRLSPARQLAARYRALAQETAAVVEGEPDAVARMSSVASMLAAAFDDFFWAGFYRVDPARPDELVVGPYQGTLGCLRIPMGRGVCGAAAQRRETVIVPDVEAFAGHIACDSRSRSEIVVPVFGAAGELLAVFDVDSTGVEAFDEADAQGVGDDPRSGVRRPRARRGGEIAPARGVT